MPSARAVLLAFCRSASGYLVPLHALTARAPSWAPIATHREPSVAAQVALAAFDCYYSHSVMMLIRWDILLPLLTVPAVHAFTNSTRKPNRTPRTSFRARAAVFFSPGSPVGRALPRAALATPLVCAGAVAASGWSRTRWHGQVISLGSGCAASLCGLRRDRVRCRAHNDTTTKWRSSGIGLLMGY